MFEVPTFGLNFNSYSSYTGSDYLLDPNYALQMTNRSFGLNYCTPTTIGNVGSPFTNQPAGGYTPRTGNSVKEDQYNELKAIAQALINSGKLGGRATELSQQLNNGETLDEKVANLKRALNDFGDEIQELLKDGSCNLRIGNKTLPELLKQAGIAYSIQKATIDELFEGLRSADNEQEYISQCLDNHDILEIISCYQTSDTNILQAISELDHNYKNNITHYICDRLIQKAEILANNSVLSESSRNLLENHINNFRNSIKSGDEIDETMITNFNKLYAFTKAAAARVVDYELQNTYGDVLDGIVADGMFYTAAKGQLQADFPNNQFSDVITLDETKKQRIENFNQRNKINTEVQPEAPQGAEAEAS